ncbi:MAG: nucleoside hydrolase [Alphaproteobacteria bacterium]|nr:nucleoside hydrolase [Alphaproteobacteria bacterium]
MTRKLIILTDPGQDQAAALYMILGAPQAFDVLGIVATAGNIDLSYTTDNCLKLLELAERTDIPVFAGCPRPMSGTLVTAEHVHGPTGLDGPDLPDPVTRIEEEHGVQFIIRTLREAPPGDITICSLSPLTNLAMALVEAPEIGSRIKEVVAMAGAYFEVGNITPTAEFNVYVDPVAADIVFRSGIALTILPLDVTHRMLSTPDRLGAMRALGSRCGIAMAEMLEFSESFDLKKYGWEGAPLHGPCVPAFMLRPEIFEGRHINVSVALDKGLTYGMTVADWWCITDREKNVFYVRDGAPEAYYTLLLECLSTLP